MLFSVKSLNSADEAQLSQANSQDAISEPIKRLYGKTDRWAPRYLALNQSLTAYVDLDSCLLVKISDLGAAFPFSEPPKKAVTPIALRSPEAILENKAGPDQVIWILGCLIVEFITGQQLFMIMPFVNDQQALEDTDDAHVLQFIDMLGPIPSQLLSRWPRSHIYCDSEGKKTCNYIGELPEGFDHSQTPETPPLKACFDELEPVRMDNQETLMIKSVLRQIFHYDPSKRPSSSEFLEHSCFTESFIGHRSSTKEEDLKKERAVRSKNKGGQ